jgi:hypothetical protein
MNRALTGTASRRQALKMLGGGVLGGALVGAGFAAATNAAAQPNRGSNPLEFGYSNAPVSNGTTFTGSAVVTHLADAGDGTLLASGVVEGSLSDGTSVDDATFTSQPLVLSHGSGTSSLEGAQAFAQQSGGSCQVLYLTLGPLELDLLGLVIELPNELIIDIRAERGPGNLLGNLLCSLVGILDGTGNASAGGGLQRLLGRINQLLSGLLG